MKKPQNSLLQRVENHWMVFCLVGRYCLVREGISFAVFGTWSIYNREIESGIKESPVAWCGLSCLALRWTMIIWTENVKLFSECFHSFKASLINKCSLFLINFRRGQFAREKCTGQELARAAVTWQYYPMLQDSSTYATKGILGLGYCRMCAVVNLCLRRLKATCRVCPKEFLRFTLKKLCKGWSHNSVVCWNVNKG